jgi:hypothetical protein
MAIDAGVFLPDVFATRDCISERRFIRGCGFHVVMAVRRQSHEDREKEYGTAVEDVSGAGLG